MSPEQKALLKRRLRADRWTLTHLAVNSHITLSHLSLIVNNKRNAHEAIRTLLAIKATEMTGHTYTADDFAQTQGDE